MWGMPTEADFLRAVIARPDDDAPRLILADWLDEQGQGERAEFIRVQCAIANPPGCPACLPRGTPGYVVGSTVRGRIIDDADCPDCMAALRRRERELESCDFTREESVFGDRSERYERHWGFRRGFVESVTCTALDWLAHGDTILACQPVREVTLTTAPRLPEWPPFPRRRWPSVKTWHLPPVEVRSLTTCVGLGQLPSRMVRITDD